MSIIIEHTNTTHQTNCLIVFNGDGIQLNFKLDKL
jgi:hypothetical protein